jgi:SOS response regulatory protein OraA/RecX
LTSRSGYQYYKSTTDKLSYFAIVGKSEMPSQGQAPITETPAAVQSPVPTPPPATEVGPSPPGALPVSLQEMKRFNLWWIVFLAVFIVLLLASVALFRHKKVSQLPAEKVGEVPKVEVKPEPQVTVSKPFEIKPVPTVGDLFKEKEDVGIGKFKVQPEVIQVRPTPVAVQEERPKLTEMPEEQLEMLRKYVYAAINQGFGKEQISKALIAKGWPMSVVEQIRSDMNTLDKGIKKHNLDEPHSKLDNARVSVQKLIEKGYSLDRIQHALKEKGWSDPAIRVIFRGVKDIHSHIEEEELHKPNKNIMKAKIAVQKLLARGYPEDKVRSALRSKGWNDPQVEEIMKF